MNIIACVDKNWGIGNKGALLDNIPEDMRFFRSKTDGKVVVMGKNTFLSIPDRPLKNRINVILTSTENFEGEFVVSKKSLEDFFRYKNEKSLVESDIFFIGGEAVYKVAVNFCNRAYITKIDNVYIADKFMPNLDKLKDWSIKDEIRVTRAGQPTLTFTEYVRPAGV